jgi:hypothetical protein
VDAVLDDFPDFAAEGVVLEGRRDRPVGQFALSNAVFDRGDVCKAVAGRRACAQNEHVWAESRCAG